MKSGIQKCASLCYRSIVNQKKNIVSYNIT